jgi:hypothetical protein
MQETCKLQGAFNQNSETFNINFSDFTEGAQTLTFWYTISSCNFLLPLTFNVSNTLELST